MRAVIQRVSRASIYIENKFLSEINVGLLVFLGIGVDDKKEDSFWLANKITNLRIFSDSESKKDSSILDIDGEVIVVSQFTLFAKTKKGNRPSYINAAPSEYAIPLYEQFKTDLTELMSKEVKSGKFGANMKVSLINDGPVTIILDTSNK